jgi:hypothetical protein
MLLTGGKIVVAVLLIAGAFFLPVSFVDNNENSDFVLQWSKKKSNIADLNIDDKAFKTIVKLTTVKSSSLQHDRKWSFCPNVFFEQSVACSLLVNIS